MSFPHGRRPLWFALPTDWDGGAVPTFAREPYGVITRQTCRAFSSPFAKNKISTFRKYHLDERPSGERKQFNDDRSVPNVSHHPMILDWILRECGGLTVGMRRVAIATKANRVPELRDGTSGQDTNSHKTNYAAVAAREPGWTQWGDAVRVGLRPHAGNRARQCSSTDLDVIIVIGDDGSHNAYVGICIGRDAALSPDRTLMSWRKMGH